MDTSVKNGNGHAAHLFALGADARLRGDPEWSGRARYACESLRWWLRGWNDVHYHWGMGVGQRWWYRPLPPVREDDVPIGHKEV